MSSLALTFSWYYIYILYYIPNEVLVKIKNSKLNFISLYFLIFRLMIGVQCDITCYKS